ncbi:hypothetical protein RNZ50_03470 [Paracoccaceae bacterium Fryx2]|nr:hypothetical protein [Paracoccaceae bacterium Fryx2]
MQTQLLDRHGAKPRPMQPLPGGLGLARGRVHEFCGMARRTLAAMVLAESSGPVIWIGPGWQAERLFPDGLRRFADPGRLIFATARRPEDLLWSMEEALRSGAAPLVLADLTAPPGLTPVRRLQLACEAGAEAARRAGRPAPLGLMLTPGGGGAAGVDSRWALAPAPEGAWRLDRLRARTDPPASWHLAEDAGRRLALAPVPA